MFYFFGKTLAGLIVLAAFVGVLAVVLAADSCSLPNTWPGI
jgi:hypothetical protein